MLRRLARDSVIYGAATIFARGAQVFLLPIYTRVFSASDLGVIDLLAVVAALVNVTIALEVSQALGRYLADARTPEERNPIASTAFWFAAGAYALFALLVSGLAPPLSLWLFGFQAGELLVLAAVAIACNGSYSVLQEALRWIGKPALYAFVSLLYTLTAIAVGLVLILIFDFGIHGVFYGQITGAVLAGLCAWLASRPLYSLRCEIPALRRMLRYSLPLVPGSVAMFVSLNADKVAINQFLSLAELGVYGVAYRLASVAQLLAIGVQLAISPVVLSAHASEETRVGLVRAFRYFCAAAFALVLFLAVFADELVGVFAVSDFRDAAPLVPVLAMAFIALNLFGFAPGLFIAKRTGSVAVIMLGGAALSAGLNAVLTPRFGLWGAALATASAATAMFAVLMAFSQRTYFVAHRWTPLALAAAVTLAIVLLRSRMPPAAAAWDPALIFGKLAAFVILTTILTLTVLGREEIARARVRLMASRLRSGRG